jgi:1,4-dihydroxy-2-naphthoate polyprenyltransferase
VSSPPNRSAGWLVAIRPQTLTVGAAPVAVGTAVAHHTGGFSLLPAVLALVGALLLQIASNIANDVYDFRKGADTEDRLGPPRAAASGLLTERELMAGLVLVLALAFAVGVGLTALAGWPILAIGIAGMVSAVAYTGGPYPLGYHGLGDVFVFAFFGLAAVAGTTFAQTGVWDPVALTLGAALGAFGAGVLTVNNVRDLDTDRQVGKRTLAVRLGRSRARAYYATLMGAPYTLVLAAIAGGGLPIWSAAVLITAPRAVALVRIVGTERGGPELNAALGGTAKLQAVFSALVAASLL